MSTKVVCKATKKTIIAYGEDKLQTVIELNIPYGADSVYFQLSGGTTMSLATTNQDAADQFEVGKSYGIVISPED